MEKDLNAIKDWFINQLEQQAPTLITKRSGENAEAKGTKEVMQGKQKVDGHYFASIVPKPKDIRFYFFPIYTHADQYVELHPEVRKMLKGKSCFHVKKLDDEIKNQFSEMIILGKKLYEADNLI